MLKAKGTKVLEFKNQLRLAIRSVSLILPLLKSRPVGGCARRRTAGCSRNVRWAEAERTGCAAALGILRRPGTATPIRGLDDSPTTCASFTRNRAENNRVMTRADVS